MKKPNLTVETVSTPVILSEAQALTFARTTYTLISNYCKAHQSEYEVWEREQLAAMVEAVV